MSNDFEIEKQPQPKASTVPLVVYLVISGFLANWFVIIDLIEKMSK